MQNFPNTTISLTTKATDATLQACVKLELDGTTVREGREEGTSVKGSVCVCECVRVCV